MMVERYNFDKVVPTRVQIFQYLTNVTYETQKTHLGSPSYLVTIMAISVL